MQLINGLHFRNIRGDIYGGLTAAVVALPLALAMGVSSGAGPIAGIYGPIFVGFFSALFGGTPAQVSGPTGPMTVVMAGMVFMKRMVDLQLESINTVRDVDEAAPFSDEEKAIFKQAQGRILLFHIGGPMSFGAAKGMARQMAQFDQYDVLVVDLSDMPQIDFTATRALEDIIVDAQDRGRRVLLAGCRPKVQKSLERQGLIAKIHTQHLHGKRIDALQDALAQLQEMQA
jgi:MFS superfamily sulfate permease-like transporter